jgi:hypothetical protein
MSQSAFSFRVLRKGPRRASGQTNQGNDAQAGQGQIERGESVLTRLTGLQVGVSEARPEWPPPRAPTPTSTRGLTSALTRRLEVATVAYLCSLYLCFGFQETHAQAPESDAPSPHSPVPEILAGDWVSVTTSGVQYWDKGTGAPLGGGGGTGVVYHFGRDGSYSETLILESRFYGCESRQVWSNQGTMTVQGHTVTLYPQTGRYQTSDSCGRVPSRDEARTGEPERFRVAIGPDPNDPTGPTRLWRTTASGVQSFTRP